MTAWIQAAVERSVYNCSCSVSRGYYLRVATIKTVAILTGKIKN